MLTSLELPQVDIIKIDVEGHEGPVLSGSSETLKAHSPILLIELTPFSAGGHPLALLDQMKEKGYVVLAFDERTGLLREVTGSDVSSENILAVPFVKRALIRRRQFHPLSLSIEAASRLAARFPSGL